MEKIQLNISDVLATVSRADIEALAPEAAKSLAKLTAVSATIFWVG